MSSSDRVAGLALPLLLLLACRPTPVEPVGVSDRRAGSAIASPEAGPRPPSPVPDDFRDHMAKVVTRQLSRGHGEKFDAIVWASEAAKPAWDTGGAMPDGAVLVEEAIERVVKGGDRPAGLLFMEKKDGAWRFEAVGPDGSAASVAEVARCAECHAQAPRDDVFRVDQSSSAASSAAMTAKVPTAVATAAATYDARRAGPADASVSP